MTYLATFIILIIFMLGLGIGYLFTKKPFQKRCALEPEKDCHCDDEKNPCENKDKH